MEKAQGFVENGNLVVTVGGVSAAQKAQGSYPQATVSVYNTGTLVLATIYADNSLTPKANPFTAATNGYFFFYGANGRYDVTFSGGGLSAPLTYGDVLLADPFASGGAVTSFNGRTGAVVPTTGDYSYSMISGTPPTAASVLLNVADYNFTAQTPGGSLIIGSNSITLTPVPAGVNGANTSFYVYISNGTGTAEAALVTGGTAVAGASSGTLIFTCANTHSGAWTIRSASFGLAEAIVVGAALGGATVVLPAGTYTPHATVRVTSGISIIGLGGTGTYTVIIQRTEDYGDTFVMGTAIAGVSSVLIANIKFTQYINYVAAPAPGTIINKPTTGTHFTVNGGNTIRFNNCRFENMVNNVVVNGGADITFDTCQWQGLWDPADVTVQVTNSSLQVNYVAALGIPTYIKVVKNQFYGNVSAAVGKHNAGPKYMIQINGCEDMEIEGGALGGASVSNLALFPSSASYILANVRVRGVKFDSARNSDVYISGDGNLSAADLIFANNVFNGENESDYAISVANPGAGSNSATGVVITGNDFLAYLATPIHLLDGIGYGIFTNIIRYYNTANTYATAENASAIYLGGRANDYFIQGNMVGGGQSYSGYGAGGNHCLNGIQIAAPTGAQANGHLFGNYPPFYSALGSLSDPVFATKILSYPDETIKIGAQTVVTNAVSLSALNDAETLNIPLEVRATKAVFPVGPVSAIGFNYIASETGANNAIVGALTNIALTAGLTVTIKLAHTLQAGANTFNYNAGGALAIKSSRNVANNIAVAYAATGTISLQYDGTQWVDLSQ
jgi:hypothetical protein